MVQQKSSSSLFFGRLLWAILAWAGMSTLCCCPASSSSPDHGVAHPEGWFWRSCRDMPELREFPSFDDFRKRFFLLSLFFFLSFFLFFFFFFFFWGGGSHGSWSCSAPSHLSCAPVIGDVERFPQALRLKSLDPFLRVCVGTVVSL